MKEFKAEFTWEDLEELGLSGFMTHREVDDDRYYEVADEWIKLESCEGRVISKINGKWLEFFLEDEFKEILSRLRYTELDIGGRVTLGLYQDGDLKLEGIIVERIIMYEGIPDFIAEVVLK